MKMSVHYVSYRGSAELIAQAVAQEAGCVKEPLMPAYMPEGVRLMFLGCEGEQPDRVMMDFIAMMNADRAAHCALFVCARNDRATLIMRNALTQRGIEVLKDVFVAPKRGLFVDGPTDQDIQRARAFAKACVQSLS